MTVTDPNYFCVTSSSIWQFAGFLLFALKIIIPLIIIILGVIDFVNATMSNKDDAITKASKSLLFRLVIGVVVFFVPLIVSLVFNLIENASSAVASADACQKCLLRPFIEDCASYVAEAKSIRENQKDLLDSSTHNMSDYETSKARCFYCPDEQQYVWTTNPKCRASQYIKRYTNQSDCENPDNLTLMPNIIGKQEEEEETQTGKVKIGSALSPDELVAKFKEMTTTPTYDELLNIAKNTYGMSEDEFKVVLGWAKGEGYERVPNSSGTIDYYLGYLCDCIGLNYLMGYGTTSAQELADKIRGRGPLSLYSLDAFIEKANTVKNNPDEYANTLKMMYLVLKYPDENAHDCDGLSNYTSYGGTVYYEGGYYGGYQTKVWSLYYEGFKHWVTEGK